MQVTTFSVGFGSARWSWQFSSGGTTYRLAPIMLGGFVKIPELEGFRNLSDCTAIPMKTRLQHVAVFLGGPAASLLFGIVLISFLALWKGMPVSENKIPAIIEMVEKDSRGEAAGLKPNDVVSEVNGKKINNWGDLGFEIRAGANKQLEITVQRNDEILRLILIPEELPNHIGYAGIRARGGGIQKETTIPGALVVSTSWASELTEKYLRGLGRFVAGDVSLRTTSGPVGIASMSGNAARAGITVSIYFIATISVILFVMNMLPIPALDGGWVAVLTIEGIYALFTGKNFSTKFIERLNFCGIAAILGLLCLGLWSDFENFF